jgi:hypothetical protein
MKMGKSPNKSIFFLYTHTHIYTPKSICNNNQTGTFYLRIFQMASTPPPPPKKKKERIRIPMRNMYTCTIYLDSRYRRSYIASR